MHHHQKNSDKILKATKEALGASKNGRLFLAEIYHYIEAYHADISMKSSLSITVEVIDNRRNSVRHKLSNNKRFVRSTQSNASSYRGYW